MQGVVQDSGWACVMSSDCTFGSFAVLLFQTKLTRPGPDLSHKIFPMFESLKFWLTKHPCPSVAILVGSGPFMTPRLQVPCQELLAMQGLDPARFELAAGEYGLANRLAGPKKHTPFHRIPYRI